MCQECFYVARISNIVQKSNQYLNILRGCDIVQLTSDWPNSTWLGYNFGQEEMWKTADRGVNEVRVVNNIQIDILQNSIF